MAGGAATASLLVRSGLPCGAQTGDSGVVWCRPLDTPDYLIPYYLRDVRSRFEHYATVKKTKKQRQRKYMSAENFVCALLGTKEKCLGDPEAARGVKALFDSLDANGDGLLSFSEFSFIMILLSSKPRDVEVLFSAMDVDERGALTLRQFEDVLLGLGDDMHVAYGLSRGRLNGVVRALFGENGTGRCTYSSLRQCMNGIVEEVWKAEFRQFDSAGAGYISAEQFGQLLANGILGTHVPFHIVDNVKRLRGSSEAVPLSTWISLHHIMRHGDEIQEAIELFCSSGLPLHKKDFNRAISASGMQPLTAMELDLIYAIFDRDGNGCVDYDEFLSLMKQKVNFHVRSSRREKVSFPRRLVHCGVESLHQLRNM